jgi:hypothetical protein
VAGAEKRRGQSELGLPQHRIGGGSSGSSSSTSRGGGAPLGQRVRLLLQLLERARRLKLLLGAQRLDVALRLGHQRLERGALLLQARNVPLLLLQRLAVVLHVPAAGGGGGGGGRA